MFYNFDNFNDMYSSENNDRILYLLRKCYENNIFQKNEKNKSFSFIINIILFFLGNQKNYKFHLINIIFKSKSKIFKKLN